MVLPVITYRFRDESGDLRTSRVYTFTKLEAVFVMSMCHQLQLHWLNVFSECQCKPFKSTQRVMNGGSTRTRTPWLRDNVYRVS